MGMSRIGYGHIMDSEEIATGIVMYLDTWIVTVVNSLV